jgi:hypothetical protein
MAVVSPDFNATTSWSGGGYDPNAPVETNGGGYDPTTGYAGNSNTIGGQGAVTNNVGTMPDYNAVQAGGWDPNNPNADADTNGGYDPNAPSPSPADSTAIRLASTGGLAAGGGVGGPRQAPSTGFQSAAGGDVSASGDWRVRIALSNSSKIFYKDTTNSLMKPLSGTNGVIFPYTPTVNITHQAMYNATQLTHSNYAMQFYQGSEVSDITITGEFTVQDANEGRYLLAAIYFFRAATKMFFGQDSATGVGAGNPPPLVYLNGYGEHYFPQVPCVISSFNHILPNEVDYIEIPINETTQSTITTNHGSVQGMVAGVDYPNWANNSGVTGQNTQSTSTVSTTTTKTTRLPTTSTISITLRPVYSRKSLHEKFNLGDFAAGKLVGGFI